MRILSIYLIFFLLSTSNSACGQQKEADITDELVGGICEGCEAIHESSIPFESLSYIDTLPGFYESEIKLTISGTVYENDRVTPANDVIVYAYHTDSKGYYSQKGNETGWGKRHGYLYGWVKTNDRGEYKFYTLRPAPYPEATEPAHIHIIVKEPGINEYYIDDIVFADDKFVDDEYRRRVRDYAGSGIIDLINDNEGNFTGTRDIILGKNISNYP